MRRIDVAIITMRGVDVRRVLMWVIGVWIIIVGDVRVRRIPMCNVLVDAVGVSRVNVGTVDVGIVSMRFVSVWGVAVDDVVVRRVYVCFVLVSCVGMVFMW